LINSEAFSSLERGLRRVFPPTTKTPFACGISLKGKNARVNYEDKFVNINLSINLKICFFKANIQ
jgi:hypothetical protein